jgi:hypothetical protein
LVALNGNGWEKDTPPHWEKREKSKEKSLDHDGAGVLLSL